jgi:hypothetical protein
VAEPDSSPQSRWATVIGSNPGQLTAKRPPRRGGANEQATRRNFAAEGEVDKPLDFQTFLSPPLRHSSGLPKGLLRSFADQAEERRYTGYTSPEGQVGPHVGAHTFGSCCRSCGCSPSHAAVIRMIPGGPHHRVIVAAPGSSRPAGHADGWRCLWRLDTAVPGADPGGTKGPSYPYQVLTPSTQRWSSTQENRSPGRTLQTLRRRGRPCGREGFPLRLGASRRVPSRIAYLAGSRVRRHVAGFVLRVKASRSAVPVRAQALAL